MLEEAEYLRAEVQVLTREEFLENPRARRALVKSIEVIGEAAKNVPEGIRRQSAQTPWRLMAGMRDNLVHGYFGIDYDLVWRVAVEHVPVLATEIRRLIEAGESGAG